MPSYGKLMSISLNCRSVLMTNVNRLEYFLKTLQNDLIFLLSLVKQMETKISDTKITCIEALIVCRHEEKEKDS